MESYNAGIEGASPTVSEAEVRYECWPWLRLSLDDMLADDLGDNEVATKEGGDVRHIRSVPANKLPAEIWLHIADMASRQDPRDWWSTVARLARVNRYLNILFQGTLYRRAVSLRLPDITVRAAAAGNLATLRTAVRYGAHLGTTLCRVGADDWPSHWRSGDGLRLSRLHCWTTPLHEASARGNYDTVAWLLKQGVDVERAEAMTCRCVASRGRGIYGEQVSNHAGCCSASTPLHMAICYRHESVARLLLSAGANPRNVVVRRTHDESKDGRGTQEPPAATAAEGAGRTWQRGEPRGGACVEICYGATALHTAAERGLWDMMEHLVRDVGLSVNEMDSWHRTPLCYAALDEVGSRAVPVLLRLGADPRGGQSRDLSAMSGPLAECRTPLDWALLHGEEDAAYSLLHSAGLAWHDGARPRGRRDGTGRGSAPVLKTAFSLLKKGYMPTNMRSKLLAAVRLLLRSWIRSTRYMFRVSLGHGDVDSELWTTYFYALQNTDVREDDLEALRPSGPDVRFHTFDQELGLLGRDAQKPFLDRAFVSCGTMALCFVIGDVSPMPAAHIKNRVRWLLDKGAQAAMRTVAADEPLPMACIFTRMAALATADITSGWPQVRGPPGTPLDPRAREEVMELLAVAEDLADMNGWNDYTAGGSLFYKSMVTVCQAYVRMLDAVTSVSMPDATAIHQRMQETMPASVRPVVSILMQKRK